MGITMLGRPIPGRGARELASNTLTSEARLVSGPGGQTGIGQHRPSDQVGIDGRQLSSSSGHQEAMLKP
jgi:hypothetical protein